MSRPANRVTFCQEAGRLRGLIGRAQREHLNPPPHLKTLDAQPSAPTQRQVQDAAAAHWCERAIHALQQAEKAWDDTHTPEGASDEA